MSKKSVFAALGLLVIGIIIGAVIVSGIGNGVEFGFASGDDVRLGGPAPVVSQNPALKAFNENFISVSRSITKSVVAVTVVTTGKENQRRMPRDFFHWFGPDLQTPEPEPSQGYGSGVIITADGYVVTNNHVVENAKEDGIEVVMHDKLRFRAKIVGTDPSTDLAVLKIDAKDLPAVAFGNSDNVQVGEWVLAVGNPLGLTSTVTQGIISAIGRDINIIQGQYGIENFIQTDAAINPGNSGGALVNLSGELVGINAAIATTNARYQGYGFAIPVNLVRSVATDLIRYGEVRRGYIGVQISPLDETLASSIGMKEAKGVLVQSVVEGGAGAAAGLRERDVILSVDGKEVNSPNALQSTIATHHPGDAVILKVYREGKILEKKVVLRPRSDDQIAEQREGEGKDSGETSAGGSKTAEFGKLGLTVRNLTPEEKKERGVENGVLVADVAAYSEAFKRGIGRDDVVLEADQKPVRSTNDLKAIIDKRKPGDAVLLRVKRDQGAPAYVAVQIPR